MIAELRGVHMALGDLAAGRPLTLLIDSKAAIGYLTHGSQGRRAACQMATAFARGSLATRRRQASPPSFSWLTWLQHVLT
jgi:hypothetical protein